MAVLVKIEEFKDRGRRRLRITREHPRRPGSGLKEGVCFSGMIVTLRD